MGSSFWYLPIMWCAYVLSVAGINAANISSSQPAMAFGVTTKWWFIFFIIAITIMLEFAIVWFNKVVE